MRTVQNTLLNDAGQPLVGVRVEIYLLAPSLNDAAFDDDQNQILSKVVVATDVDGVWSVDLIPNILITPANTVYQCVEYIIGQPNGRLTFILPDTSGTHLVQDLLVQPPDDLPSEAALIAFDPEGTGLESTNVQDAITEAFNSGGNGGAVLEVVAGDGIEVDASNPAHPIVSATGGGGGSSELVTTTVTLTDDLSTAFSVPLEVLPAPGAGKFYILLNSMVESVPGAAGWGENATVVLIYGPGPYSISPPSNVAAAAIFTSLAPGPENQMQGMLGIGISNRTITENAEIRFSAGDHDITFDGTINLYLTYWIAEFAAV